ncbi:hypothetical protein [Geitlerinema sp. PCC 7407]|uniref:hypothetical protein n=1 Tax=Geitlerinema sp. PCC 7407 TaxID=1173025 RepID=UPI0012372D85|nr:hypothetical protein [Geitlerinema sp. PCC 7407]
MMHPFELFPQQACPEELDFSEAISEAEAAQVGGGLTYYTTLALGEEGGSCFPDPIDWEPPKPTPICPGPVKPPAYHPIKPPIVIDPPEMTTLALGEEGGCWPGYELA